LLVTEERDDAMRYRYLETIREYAAEKLEEASGADRVKDRHRDYFLVLAEEAEAHLRGADEATWLDRVETEHDNLRAALAWCFADLQGVEAGLRLSGALWRFWLVRGYVAEGREQLRKALERRGGSRTAGAAKALNSAGVLAVNQGDHGAGRALLEECLTL